jgi:hypothetical protein
MMRLLYCAQVIGFLGLCAAMAIVDLATEK